MQQVGETVCKQESTYARSKRSPAPPPLQLRVQQLCKLMYIKVETVERWWPVGRLRVLLSDCGSERLNLWP